MSTLHHISKKLAAYCLPSLQLKHFSRDKNGVAAIEFAFIAPLMIILFLGAVEMSHALTVDRRVTAVASTTADLAAQNEEITTAEINDIFALSSTILAPYDAPPLQIVLTSVVADENNNTTVAWSQGYNGGTAHTPGAAFSLPAALTQPLSSVIIAEVNYGYQSPITEYITGVLNLTDTLYLRPRKSQQVVKTD